MMSGYDNIYRPSADLSQDITKAAIRATRKQRKKDGADRSKDAGVLEDTRELIDNTFCDAVEDMRTFENQIHNTSPNATNIGGGV